MQYLILNTCRNFNNCETSISLSLSTRLLHNPSWLFKCDEEQTTKWERVREKNLFLSQNHLWKTRIRLKKGLLIIFCIDLHDQTSRLHIRMFTWRETCAHLKLREDSPAPATPLAFQTQREVIGISRKLEGQGQGKGKREGKSQVQVGRENTAVSCYRPLCCCGIEK